MLMVPGTSVYTEQAWTPELRMQRMHPSVCGDPVEKELRQGAGTRRPQLE